MLSLPIVQVNIMLRPPPSRPPPERILLLDLQVVQTQVKAPCFLSHLAHRLVFMNLPSLSAAVWPSYSFMLQIRLSVHLGNERTCLLSLWTLIRFDVSLRG